MSKRSEPSDRSAAQPAPSHSERRRPEGRRPGKAPLRLWLPETPAPEPPKAAAPESEPEASPSARLSVGGAPAISVVVPMHNEAEVLDSLFARLCPVLEGLVSDLGRSYEIVCVNGDGSS